MSNDLGFDIKKNGVRYAFRVHCLVENNSVMTAIGNDLGWRENIFLEQLKIHYSPGDFNRNFCKWKLFQYIKSGSVC